MKKILLAFLFILPLLSNAQGEASWWFFGENASLDFSTGVPLPGPNGSLFTTEGCSTISDECGNLLFYSDGSQVWDRNGTQMPNGFGLSGNGTSAQSAIIIPDLTNSNVYFVITVFQVLEYSIVNMNLNGGLGDVVPGRKNISLLTSTQEKVTATLNDNGDRYWIVGFDNGTYTAWQAGGGLVDTNPARVITSPIAASNGLNDSRGYLRLSPDATKIVNTSVGDPLLVCDFNNTNGVVSNPITLTNPGSTSDEYYGAEFSPNSRMLYVNANSNNGGNGNITNNSKQLLQYDTQGAAGWQNAPVILSTDVGEGRGALQLGIDGKIYHARTYTQSLGVVRDPDAIGTGANYVHNGVVLPAGMRCREGLPPFITSFFEPSFLATDANMGSGGGNNNPETDFCDGTPIQFDSSGSGLCTTATVNWDFGDGTTDNTFNPVHTFPAPGDYTVTLTVTSGFYSNTAVDVISIYEIPVANPVTNVVICDVNNDNTEDYDLTILETPQILGTQTNPSFVVTYFLTQNAADNNSNPIAMPYSFTANITTIYARITNDLNAASRACFETTSFTVTLDPAPVANPVMEYRLCDDVSNNGSEVFDLASRNPEVLGAQTAANFSIEYFVSQAGADLGSIGGATPVAFNYSSGGQTMYVRIENATSPDCYDTTSFDLVVDDIPVAAAPMTLVLCDDTTNDGIEDITLSQFDADVLNGQTQTTFVISYHASQADADNDASPLPGVYQVSLGTTTVYARIDNSDNETCASVVSFDIILNEQAIANTVTEYRICDDASNDGLEDFDLSTKDVEVLGAQTAANFNIEYFTSQADADLGSVGGATPLAIPYNSGDNTIFVRIETIANADCYNTTSFDIFVDDLPIAGTPADVVVCDDPSNDGVEDVNLSQFDAEILNGQTNPSFVVSYHASQADADNDASPLASPFTVSTTTPNLFARIDNGDNNDCYTTTTFQFVVSPTPTANAVQNMIACDDAGNDGSEIFDLSNADAQVLNGQNAASFNITYHPSQADADANTAALPASYPSSTTTPETVYVRIESNTNTQCYDTTSFTLTVSEQPTAGVALDQRGCDDVSNDGIEEFDFSNVDVDILNGQSAADFTVTYHTSQANADSGANALTFPYTNVSQSQTIYARIENNVNTDCYDTSTFGIEVFARPVIANQGPITICAGIDEVLDAGAGYSSYLWSTGEMTQTITVNQGGDYDVTVFNADGCDSTATITVIESDVAVIERIDIGQFEVNTNQLTAIVTGSGDYEYSLDDFVYQDSPRFNNLYPGYYTIYVKDKNGCGTVSMDAVIIGGPPYFTPNQDGYHDTWQVIAIETVPDANIYIFDRYGKLIKQIDAQGIGWDGTYNGNPMPSSDYWYLVELSDGRSFKGHFALKR
ncbi:T9SS type B sorting domain-containing protein [Nonlabens ulvanivorans]|uniref:T9SS type B sorting domain-containing protein n=1 Tax=Nonlabens ulvanivorans TaxID=906888 RepID=UPI0029430D27|nr:T9SS type B sorting domain-containing protein [Nonlabens ulvanivorans]WOI23665.1 T9SS type B sorting domain-containing protein [Nonlabens ulvanivorans]